MDRSILIIDNDTDILDLLAFVFEDKGFTVYTARDGAEGVALARRHKPPVIIADMMMERMHGFEVLQRIRSEPDLDRATVIVVSAKSYKADVDRAKALGANEYVVKPFKTEELFAMVERHLASSRPAGESTEGSTRGPAA